MALLYLYNCNLNFNSGKFRWVYIIKCRFFLNYNYVFHKLAYRMNNQGHFKVSSCNQILSASSLKYFYLAFSYKLKVGFLKYSYKCSTDEGYAKALHDSHPNL